MGVCSELWDHYGGSSCFTISTKLIALTWFCYEQFFQSPHPSLRKLALGSVNQYIMLMPAVSSLCCFHLVSQSLLDAIVILGDNWLHMLISRRLYMHPWISTFKVCLLLLMTRLQKCENWWILSHCLITIGSNLHEKIVIYLLLVFFYWLL
jgi:hypothetical protein